MNETSLKPVITKLEDLFSKFNKKFYNGELQTPIITVSPDTTKGAYGWCTAWKAWSNTEPKKPSATEDISKLTNLLPVTGEMACDSKDRMNAYRQTGCNMFDGSRPKSKPLGAATEQTVLHFIYAEQIPIAPVYGEVVYDAEHDIYRTTGEIRTGCKMCGFGLMFDPERFIRLQKYEPKIVQFAFTSVENGGLGYGEICSFLNENCGMSIAIPEIEQGYYPNRLKKEGEKNE